MHIIVDLFDFIGLCVLGVRWHLEYDQEHDDFVMTKGGIK